MTKAPNYRIIVALPALDPTQVEVAWLELQANSPEEAYDLAECFLRPEAELLACMPILKEPA